MSKPNWKQIFAIKSKNEERIKQMIPNIKKIAGIYFFYRTDENGIRHGYIGKAETNILQRIASHLTGYDTHIDKSIRKHGLCDKEQYGYHIRIVCYCNPKECDELERKYIKQCADAGWQMKNTETGGTNGKTLMNERKEPKGYRDGVAQGKKQLAKELKHIIDLHLDIRIKQGKENNKISQNGLTKFYKLINDVLDSEQDN